MSKNRFRSFPEPVVLLLLLAIPSNGQEDRPPPTAPTVATAPQPLPPGVRRRQGNKRYTEAIGLARKALEADPDGRMLHFALGTLLFAVDDYRGALAEFNAEIAHNPGHFESLKGLAAAHTGLGELEASLPHLERCLELRPESADVAFELGRNLSTLGRLDDAEPHLFRAAETSGSTRSLVELGVLHRRRGDLESAGHAFRRAVAGDARDPAALYNYGQTLILQGRREEGARILAHHAELATEVDYLERFGQANRLDATAANSIALAEIHRGRQDYDAALEAFTNAIQLDPTRPAAMLGGAEVHLARGDLDRAGRWAGRVATLDSKNSRPHFILGLVNLRRGQPRASEIDFTTSRKLGEWTTAEYLELGETYRQLDDSDGAAGAFGQAVEFDPGDARGHRELARVRWLRGEKAPALESIARAVELDPGDGDAWMLAGIMRSGQASEDAFRSALDAQTVDLLATGGLQQILDRFADLPGSALALDLYRRLYRSLASFREDEPRR